MGFAFALCCKQTSMRLTWFCILFFFVYVMRGISIDATPAAYTLYHIIWGKIKLCNCMRQEISTAPYKNICINILYQL